MDYKLLAKARVIASEAHEGQMYGEHHYVYHLEQVALSLEGKGDEYVAVAWLHDILEDTYTTEGDLVCLFGYTITNAVMALTKIKGEKYSDYLDKVSANKIALTVKIHDTLCNLTESVKTGQWGRVRKYSEQMKLLAVYK